MAELLPVLAKYPFLREAKDYIASLNLTLEEISRHPAYSSSIDLGKKRVYSALEGRIRMQAKDRVSQELAIMSYAMARIIAQATENQQVMGKHAAAEARNAYYLLRKESSDLINQVKEDLGFEVENGRMDFVDYLRLTKNLRENRWRLVNRIVEDGRVSVGENEDLELLRQAVRLRVLESIDLRNVPENFKNIAKQVNDSVMGPPLEVSYKQLKTEALPPCIRKMISSLEQGGAGHQQMFILGTFFIGLGLPLDDIVRVFSVSPKFDEEKTRYQIEFLSGEKGTTKYTCPTCVKIKSYGLCVQDCGITHPLKYYRDRVKNKR